MKFIKKIFAPKEVKITLNIIDEIGLNYLGTAYPKIKKYMETVILDETRAYVDNIQSGTNPREWVLLVIAKRAGDLLESGHYHLYRGVLNPMGEGIELLKIYDSAIDELHKMQFVDKKYANGEKKH